MQKEKWKESGRENVRWESGRRRGPVHLGTGRTGLVVSRPRRHHMVGESGRREGGESGRKEARERERGERV